MHNQVTRFSHSLELSPRLGQRSGPLDRPMVGQNHYDIAGLVFIANSGSDFGANQQLLLLKI